MPENVIKYKRNQNQIEFSEDVETKFLHLSTGFGGGKTYASAMKIFQLSRINRNVPGGILVTSLPDYKRDLLPTIEEILETNRIKFRYHKTDKWFLFPWSRAKAYVASAEKKIRGPNWGWCVCNEVTLIEHERYKEAIGRVRIKGVKYPQIASSGTPEGLSCWVYEHFIEKPMRNSRIIFGDTRANSLNLSDDYIASLEYSYDPVMLDSYLRGLFVNMNGNRFYYSYDPNENDDRSIKRIDGAEVYVTLDYNVRPMVATLWNVVALSQRIGDKVIPLLEPGTGRQVRRAQAFDQIVIADGAQTSKMSDALYAADLLPESTTIYPDPAGNHRSTKGMPDNKILEAAGWFKIRSKSAAPQFRRRQLAANNMLAKRLVVINPDKCKALKKDLAGVEQDAVTYEKIKVNPDMTHASDGMDYFIDIEFPLSGQKPDSHCIKYR